MDGPSAVVVQSRHGPSTRDLMSEYLGRIVRGVEFDEGSARRNPPTWSRIKISQKNNHPNWNPWTSATRNKQIPQTE